MAASKSRRQPIAGCRRRRRPTTATGRVNRRQLRRRDPQSIQPMPMIVEPNVNVGRQRGGGNYPGGNRKASLVLVRQSAASGLSPSASLTRRLLRKGVSCLSIASCLCSCYALHRRDQLGGISGLLRLGRCGSCRLRAVTYVSAGCGGCGTPTAAVVYAQPVAPAPVVYGAVRAAAAIVAAGSFAYRAGGRGDRRRAGAALRRQSGTGLYGSRHHGAVSHLDAVARSYVVPGSYPYGYGYHRYGYAHRPVYGHRYGYGVRYGYGARVATASVMALGLASATAPLRLWRAPGLRRRS